MALYTIGHGSRTLDELLEVLGAAAVDLVVDVRRFPGSRRHPQFGRDPLRAALQARRVRYRWAGDELGGRRSPRPDSRNTALRDASFRGYADHMATPVFREALEVLLSENARTAIMCAEAWWVRCHRRLIADAAVARGAQVVHLVDPGRTEVHRLTPGARVVDGWPRYDGGELTLGDGGL